MCEYCEKNKDLSNSNAHEIRIKNDVITFESFDEWCNQNSYEEIPIKFCPMCGRKLTKPTCKDCNVGNCNNREEGHWCPEFTE